MVAVETLLEAEENPVPEAALLCLHTVFIWIRLYRCHQFVCQDEAP